MTENETNEQNFKITNCISKIDDELKDRFKALYTIQSICKDFDEEEVAEIRKLEIQYENKYKQIYSQRERIINSKDPLPDEII